MPSATSGKRGADMTYTQEQLREQAIANLRDAKHIIRRVERCLKENTDIRLLEHNHYDCDFDLERVEELIQEARIRL